VKRAAGDHPTRHVRAAAWRTPGRLAILAGALTIPALVIATQLYVGYRLRGIPVAFGAVFVLQLCHWELWAVAGPMVWDLERRWPVAPPDRRTAFLRHAAMAPLVSTLVLLANLAVYHAVVRVPLLSGWFTGLDRSWSSTATFFAISYFHVELLVYGGIVALAHAVRTTAQLRASEHDALQLEAAVTTARLTALRTQLQPHFLFNTLHTIGSLVLQGQNDRAVELLAELGELLRATLAHRDTDLAPLSDEIAYLRRYLRIEEARFADRLRIEWAIDPAAEDVLMPPFILQPVVENAFRHGIAHREDHSLLQIAAALEDGWLRISIYNDGPPLPSAFAPDHSCGYGLKNVLERLRTGDPAGRVELANTATGVRVTLLLPRWDAAGTRRGR
jgi:two-component system, LytTR family, sensor kinase